MPAKCKKSSRAKAKAAQASDDIENDDRSFKKEEQKEKLLAEMTSFE